MSPSARTLHCRAALSLLLPCLLAAQAPDARPSAPERRPEVVWNNVPTTPHPLVTHRELASKAMARTVGYTVYLPPGYEREPDRRHPVIYFLHGMGGNENADGPAFAGIVDRLVRSGAVPPAICVFPNGGRSGYRDHAETGINVETMIVQELVPLIDREYRTRPERASRFLGGYSMGGGGAVRLALLHPHLFGAAASLAGAMGNLQTGEPPAELSVERLRAQEPTVRLLLVTGYDDQTTHRSHWPFLERLREASYPYTLRTLRGVPHRLGPHYDLAGEDFVRFLLAPSLNAPDP